MYLCFFLSTTVRRQRSFDMDGFALPLGSCAVGDLVVTDKVGGSGTAEYVARVTHVTKSSVTLEYLEQIVIKGFTCASEARDESVLAEPIRINPRCSHEVFRWSKRDEWYQSKEPRDYIVRAYKPGDVLKFQAYY
jgi:hypothetical protein